MGVEWKTKASEQRGEMNSSSVGNGGQGCGLGRWPDRLSGEANGEDPDIWQAWIVASQACESDLEEMKTETDEWTVEEGGKYMEKKIIIEL